MIPFKEFLESSLGDCYQQSYKYFNEHYSKDKKLRLIHGLVTGQGSLEGVIYNHAWCESSNKVIDMTQKNPEFIKKDYYNIGKIKTVFEYDFNQMIEKSIEYGTYGPWEKILLRNKY